MKKKAIKEIDFSKGEPNKFYGRPKIIIGDKRYPRQPDPSGKLFRFVNTRTGRFVDIRAANKKEARLIFLKRYHLTRRPAGVEIKEIKEDALKSETQRKKVSLAKPRGPKKKTKPKLPLVVEEYGGEPYEYLPMGKYVVAARDVCGGRPTIKYRRLDARHIMALIDTWYSARQVAQMYKIPIAAVKEVIALARKYDYEASYIKGKPRPRLKFKVKRLNANVKYYEATEDDD